MEAKHPSSDYHARVKSRAGGTRYSDIHIEGGKTHLGDAFYFGIDSPLNRLPYAVDAPFNAFNQQDKQPCLEGTRVDVLRQIYDWADGQDERCMFWLSGLAGMGKSTISRTVAGRYFNCGRLGASFFFSRGGGDVGNAGKLFTSVALQLADRSTFLQRAISEAVRQNSAITTQSLRDQWRQLVYGPLSEVDSKACQPSYVLIVDALDECDDENHIKTILILLAEARSLKNVRLRVFITSRQETPIRSGFLQVAKGEHQDFVLHDISQRVVDHDISLFLTHDLALIGQQYLHEAGWPGAEDIKRLVQSASGLFEWAATAYRFIRDGRSFAADRLSIVLKDGSTNEPFTDDSATDDDANDDPAIAPEENLNNLYITVLRKSARNYKKNEKRKWYKELRRIIGTIVVLFSPLSAPSLAGVLHVRREDVLRTLNDLRSILDIPEERAQPIRLHHPSFRDFLLARNRCTDPNFQIDEKRAHQTLAESCIRLMSTSLRQDICEPGGPGVLVTKVKSSRVKQCIPLEVQYACLYWIQHLQKSGTQLCDNDQVHQFLKEHLLHWLEALSWMREISKGIHAITSLESIALISDCPDLYAFIHDMKRFALYNRPAIEQAPLQVYYSALVFAPTMSIVKKQFKNQVPRLIQRLPVVGNYWNALLQTLEGHSRRVAAVTFSPDGKTLASASYDNTVKLWDAGTGAILQTLESHSNRVTAVTFSPDGKTLASASYDNTVKLWDAGTGAVLQTLEGHSDWATAVAFSPDGKALASASYDKTVKLWDVGAGAVLQTLEGHSNKVTTVAFSPDGKALASASKDKTVKLWNADTGAILQTLEGYSDVQTLSFSDDGSFLKTNKGMLRITSLPPGKSLSRRNLSRGILVKEQWIMHGMDNVLWLPFEYRPRCTAVHGSVVALAHGRRVSILEFAS